MKLSARPRRKPFKCDEYQMLIEYLKKSGPIPTVRVSCTSAGKRKFSYYDAVRYELRLSSRGEPIHRALGRATAFTRSINKAEKLVNEIAQREGRLRLAVWAVKDWSEIKECLKALSLGLVE